MDIKDTLNAAIEAAGLTHFQAALALGRLHDTVSQWTRGKSTPKKHLHADIRQACADPKQFRSTALELEARLPKTKTCRLCGREQPRDDFAVSTSHSDGRNTACKMCRSALDAACKLRRRKGRTMDAGAFTAQANGSRWCPGCARYKDIKQFFARYGKRSEYCMACVRARRERREQGLKPRPSCPEPSGRKAPNKPPRHSERWMAHLYLFRRIMSWSIERQEFIGQKNWNTGHVLGHGRGEAE